MKYIPIAHCGVCPYQHKHHLAQNLILCNAMTKGCDNDISFNVANTATHPNCPLPEFEITVGDNNGEQNEDT